MKRPKITFLMRAYNAEKYIKQTIESVLNQTDGDFEFFIRNNGSTDKTGEIIRKYADADSRITYLSNKKNWVLDEGDTDWWPPAKGEYFSIIDADDYLDPYFIEIMYAAAKEHDADLTVCGATLFRDGEHKNTARIPPAAAVTDLSLLKDIFIDLYGTLRTVWGKLYKVDFYVEHYHFAHNAPIHSGALDTYSVLGYLQKCRSFVSVDKSLYYYRIYDNSSSRQSVVEKVKIAEAGFLFNRGKECLETLGIATQQNMDSLYLIHRNHILDAASLVNKSKVMSGKEKILYYQDILKDELYCSYALDPAISLETISLYCEYAKNAVLADSSLLNAKQREYLVSLYLSFEEIRKKQVSLLTLPRLLYALCNEDNPFFVGIDLLNAGFSANLASKSFFAANREKKKQILSDIKKVREIFSTPENEDEFIKAAKEIDKDIAKGEYIKALEKLNRISADLPLSPECLLYRIYLSYQLGDAEFALDTANIAVFFWPDEPEITALAEDLWKALNC